MELQYFGANCLKINTKQASIIIDDNLDQVGLKNIIKPDDIALFSSYREGKSPKDAKLVIDQPGEYEVSAVSVLGVPARAHMDEEDKETAIMYRLVAGDIRIVVVGHIYPDLSESQLEALGTIDVLVVPVGGSGYTLDPTGALKVIKKIEPKIVIPVHYADKAVKYEVPQIELDEALKTMSMEASEKVDKLKLKNSDLPEAMQLIVLERQ